MHQNVRTTREITYREGDGVTMAIPVGPCELEVTELDVTISWVDGDSRGSTAIPVSDYKRYVDDGALVAA